LSLDVVATALFCVLNFTIAGYIYVKNPAATLNRSFALFGASASLWALGIAFSHNLQSFNPFAARLTFAAASFIPVSILFLFVHFPYRASPYPVVIMRAALLLGASFSTISFSSLIAKEAFTDGKVLKVVYGPLYPLFGIYFLGFFIYSIVVLIRRQRASVGLVKFQLRYLILGLIAPGLAGTLTNLVIPLAFGTSRFARYGPLFSVIFLLVTAHAIIRYRFMDTRVFIQKGVVYACAIAVTVLTFATLLVLGSYFGAYEKDRVPLGIAVTMAVLVASFFQPVRRWLQDSFNRYVYRQTYDYQRTLREASRRLSTFLNLDSLLMYLNDVIANTLKVELIAVYLRDDQQQAFTPKILGRAAPWQQSASNPVLPFTSSLVAFLERENRPLVRDEAAAHSPDQPLIAAIQELQTIGGAIAFPLIQDAAASGLLIVGPKLSGDPYFAEDIDLLSTLVSQAAIAIRNSQLYQEVARVNEYVANIVATMESGVIAVGANACVTLFNPAAERITGLQAEAVRSRPITNLPAALAHSLEATLADGQPRVQPDTTISDTAGRLTPVSCATYPLRDSSGNALGVLAVFSDLSRLKELEEERRQAERLASIGAMASGIAHEIKNPLVAIKTFAELLPERFTEEDFREDFSKVVIREIDRIDDLVARLRGLAGPSAQRLTPLDLRDPIEDTLALLRAQLEQKHIHLRRLYHPNLPAVSGDPAQLKQLFLNLFMNALEAMDHEGELTVHLHKRSKQGEGTVLVRISDTGSGIPESILGKIFDPFVTTKARGSGLGLAICRGIADAHGATMRAENNPKRLGSTITVEFPAVLAITGALQRLKPDDRSRLGNH
jgi:PAS domain S-box-containing protein